jgi:hypothetical protein
MTVPKLPAGQSPHLDDPFLTVSVSTTYRRIHGGMPPPAEVG